MTQPWRAVDCPEAGLRCPAVREPLGAGREAGVLPLRSVESQEALGSRFAWRLQAPVEDGQLAQDVAVSAERL